MKNSILPIFVLLILTIAPNLMADPIDDTNVGLFKAAWISNASRGEPLTCAQACKEKLPPSLPEYEGAPGDVIKRAFVCKVAGRAEGNVRTWLFGNQFDERPACYTTDTSQKGTYSQNYHCLCAVDAGGSATRSAAPVLSPKPVRVNATR
jgi:hypothetical protein